MTQSLLQRATELSGNLADFRLLQLSAEAQSVIVERTRELASAKEKLQSPLNFLEALRSHPELQGVQTPEVDLTQGLEAVRRAQTLARDDPEGLLKGTSLLSMLNAVKGASTAAEAAAGIAWRQVVATFAPPARPELLEVLAQIPSYRQGVEELRAWYQRAQALTGSVWPSASDLSTFVELGRLANEWWENLGGSEGLSNGVLEFLVACAHQGAELEAMTPEITSWIDSRGLRTAFRIRLSGS